MYLFMLLEDVFLAAERGINITLTTMPAVETIVPIPEILHLEGPP